MRHLMAFIAVLLMLFSCKELEDYVEEEHSVKDIEGTVRLELPIEWEQGQVGGTWNTSFSREPTGYNPFATLDDSHFAVTSSILDYLFDYDPITGEWSGNIIDSWTVELEEDTGRMKMTCTLKSNVYWSDGVQMTADDVVFTYNELEGNPQLSLRSYQGQFVTMPDGSEEQILIEKAGHLSFTYIFPRQVATPMLMVNTNHILPMHIWQPVVDQGLEAVKQFWGIDTPPEDLIGNGSFLLESYKPGERLIFRRNPNYWKMDEWGISLPYIERVISTFIPPSNATADLLKFQQGELESYSLRGQDLATLLPESLQKDFSIWNGGPSTGYPFLTFNMNPVNVDPELHNLFSDKRFRHAMSALIDRETIIDQTLNGLAEPQLHLFGPNNKYYNPDYVSPYSYYPQGAMDILKELGLEDTDGDGMLQLPSGKPLEFTILTANQDPVVQDFLNIIISDLEDVGIKATLEVIDFNLWVQKIMNTYDWQCTMIGGSFPTFPEQWYNVWSSDGDLHYWYPKQEEPATQWEARLDELYEALIYTFEETEIQPLYDEFQQILMDQLPMIPIYNRYSFLAVYNKWGNVNWDSQHSMGDESRRLFLMDGQE